MVPKLRCNFLCQLRGRLPHPSQCNALSGPIDFSVTQATVQYRLKIYLLLTSMTFCPSLWKYKCDYEESE